MPPEVEDHPRPTLLSDFILGSQDGLVNVLGILLGLVVATRDPRIILIATLAALAAESISMGAVAYTSTLARRNLYLSEVQREMAEMRVVPHLEQEEVRVILRRWGYEGAEVEEMLARIEAKPKAMLDIMMAFELNLSEVKPEQPRNSALVVFGATVAGSIIPILPFFFLSHDLVMAAIIAIILSALVLCAVGYYEATATKGSTWRSALRMVIIGIGSGFAGFLIGVLVKTF
ncbi:MAG TPA: VIT1/CCC1 transporter family protein [Thermoplasmata archaeon]|nr:VIT1/CCC1 transporter family protein [Thermoplasmata archaeon]